MDKLELIKKIKALAEQGTGGEKFNAQQKLEELMKKYDISNDDLAVDILKDFNFNVKREIDKKLLSQILYSVCGDIDERKGVYHCGKKFFIRCTDAEFLEIDAKFDFYKKEYEKQAKLFYRAFIQANSIFPPKGLIREDHDFGGWTSEDYKVSVMALGIDKSNFYKRIEGR